MLPGRESVAVPEVALNEDGYLFAGYRYVRCAWRVLVVFLKIDLPFSESSKHQEFNLGVFAPDFGHYLAADFF